MTTTQRPSPEAREAAREWLAGEVATMDVYGGDRAYVDSDERDAVLRSLFAQPPDVQAAIRDELGGGAS